jgi:hypothetical protein
MKHKVNFEYDDQVIPIMLDESLIHINNLTNQMAENKDDLDELTEEWDDAYDYLVSKCYEAFFEQTDFNQYNVMLDGFLQAKEDDPSGLRVRMITIIS